jgi:uncharacterized protein (TIGR02594 family)
LEKNNENMESRELMWNKLMTYWGLSEVPGPMSNEIIMSWFKEFGFDWVKDDETAWCSLTINKVAKDCGLEYTGKLDARSWNKIGKQIIDPEIGHIVVFWRGNHIGWQGHVGLFAGYSSDKKHIYTLGGNQGNSLCIKPYPIDGIGFGLLGFRELFFKT